MISRSNHPVCGKWLVILTLAWHVHNAVAQSPGIVAGPITNSANSHQYFLLEPASWTNAEAAAVNLGGHLVTINSAEENSWIFENLANYGGTGRDVWIGFLNPVPGLNPPEVWKWLEKFQWISGQPVNVTLWRMAESAPTNSSRFGFSKMCGAFSWPSWDKSSWTQEPGESQLSGVAEVTPTLEIVAQPQDVVAGIGGTANMTIAVDGPRPISYQWRFGGSDLAGQTSSILTLTNLQFSQDGYYEVVVANAKTTNLSASAKLTVSSVIGWAGYHDYETNVPAGIGHVRAISAGEGFSLALRTDGTVVGWGSDIYAQTEPPSGLTGVVAIAAGGAHSIALKDDGSIVCWGWDAFGATEPPAGISNAVAVAAGSSHSLALLKNGTVVFWGLYTSAEPTPNITNAVAIACGTSHNLVLTAEGKVKAWAVSANSGPTAEMTRVPDGLTEVVAIAAGAQHSLALKADGTVVAWGNNGLGQTDVPPDLTNAVAISAGAYHSLALTSDGRVVAWGDSTDVWPRTPPTVPNAMAIAAGYYHDLMLVGDGTPCFKVEPWDRQVPTKGEIIFAAKAVGAPPWNYQWQFKGADIPGATQDIFKIVSADPTNAGYYSVLIVTPRDTIASRRALLTVMDVTNQAPVLPVLNEMTVQQFLPCMITNTAADPDGFSDGLTYLLMAAPEGMTIDDSGIIRWTPGLTQAPSTNEIVTVVRDQGSPPLVVTNHFTLKVTEWTNTPPAILAGPVVNPATGHRYLLLDRAAWTNAEAAALALGGHLVTINNPEENSWVYDTFGTFNGVGLDLWIGLFDPNPAVHLLNPFRQLAKYGWSSGQPVSLSANMWAEAGPFDIAHTNSGYFKLCGPGNPNLPDRGLWADEQVYVPLHSVVELPQDLEVISQPQSGPIGIGCDATLSVFADGSTPLSYQWQRSGTNILGQTLSNLILKNIQFSQSGSYSVIVSNRSGSILSQPAEVSVVSIVTWGSFGGGDDARMNVPPGLTNVIAVAAGFFHDLALKSDGTVVAWGQNAFHQSEVPEGLTNVIAIAGGSGHSLALKDDGTVVAWGIDYGTTTQVPWGLTNVVAIDAGQNNNLALKTDGTVVAWGQAFSGPSIAPPGLTNVVAISAGAGHDLALFADGTVMDWNDATGELNSTPPDLTNAIAISAGFLSSLALKADGTVVGWGTGMDYGGSLKIPTDLTNAAGISIKWDHSLAMTVDGSMVAAWGTNFSGESSVPPRLPNVVAIAGGYYHSIALLRNGAPNLTVQPWDRLVAPGSSPALSAKAVSREKMNYQWKFNGTNLTGATRDTLRIPNAQPVYAGTYTLSISNGVGVVASRQAKLIVSASVRQEPLHPPTWLLGWWPAEGDGNDLLGQKPGSLINGVGFTQGVLGQAFDFHGSDDYVQIPNPNPVNLAMLTIECWIYPRSLPEFEMVIASKGGGAVPKEFVLSLVRNGQDQLNLRAFIESYSNHINSIALQGSNCVPLNKWTHVAMTFNFIGDLRLYQNGSLEATTNALNSFAAFPPPTTQPWRIGGGVDASFDGSIDEFCLYQDPLSGEAIKNIYESTKSGRPLPPEVLVPPKNITTGLGSSVTFSVIAASPGGTPLSYQWQFKGNNLTGETNSTLILHDLRPADSGPYAVQISNSADTTTSTPGALAVAGVVAWGDGDSDGQLDVPAGLMNVTAVVAGGENCFALKADGTVVGWGSDVQNQLHIPPGLTNVVALSAGGNYSLALKADGTVVAWGGPRSPASAVPLGLSNAIAVAAAGYYGVVLRADGTLMVWDEYGNQPAMPSDWTNVVAIARGGLHFLALKADGTVGVWGDNSYGQANIPPGLTNVVAIDGNIFQSMALKADGTVVVWGGGGGWYSLTNVPSGLSNVVAICAAESFNLALKADGTLVEFGGNDVGLAVPPPALPNVVGISAGDFHVVALLRDGAPQITVQPWDQVVKGGARATLAAKAVGLQAMNYQWLRDGSAIPGATADTLTMAEAQPSASGVYMMTVSNELGIVATRKANLVVSSPPLSTNHPPILPSQPIWSIYESIPLVVVNTATDPDHSDTLLNYQLINPPAGMTIDPAGVIHWTPAEDQGPETFVVTTIVSKAGEPLLRATNKFTVVVNEMNSPPALLAQPDRTVSALAELFVTNQASDPDIPTNVLSYRLVNAPLGATIDSSGVIRWIPTRAQAPATNAFITIVTDNGTPGLSATNSFNVIVLVNPPPTTKLEPVSLKDGTLMLRISGIVGPRYTLQGSVDLLKWTDLQTTAPASLPFDLRITSGFAVTNNFYRVRLEP